VATMSAAALVSLATAIPGWAQVTPAAGYTPPDDTPAIKVGATIFADYTVLQTPKVQDTDGNHITSNAFNVGRAYINITGNISHNIAFRITPDITRESGITGSSISGNYVFRLKYAYAQFNLDDYINPNRTGSWIRLGMQQTPYVDFMEGIYRYRFQGTIFEERDGFLSSSDIGASFHYNLPRNYGDIHTGIYNGETYTKPEANDQKGFMIRGSLRPLHMHPVLRGLRVTGFYDADAYVKNGERTRGILSLTFEHKYLNAALDYLAASDQATTAKPATDGHGFSMWATPRTTNGWEALVRYDQLEPNTGVSGTRKRAIGGIAYWFPHQGAVSTALLFDVEQVTFADFLPAQPKQRRVAVHGLVNFLNDQPQLRNERYRGIKP
jgi:hypothetical protein